MLAPLTVVLESDTDLRKSEGLALIDDVSRLLSHQRQLIEVRSATQPLGTTKPLDRARLASRLGEVNVGFQQLEDGAGQAAQGADRRCGQAAHGHVARRATGLTSRKPVNRVRSARDRPIRVCWLGLTSSAVSGGPGCTGCLNLLASRVDEHRRKQVARSPRCRPGARPRGKAEKPQEVAARADRAPRAAQIADGARNREVSAI